MSIRDNPSNILGFDSADNQFASTNDAANADGSIIERQEYIQTKVDALTASSAIPLGTVDSGTSSTTEIPIASLAGYGNDAFNSKFYLLVLKNANSAGNAPDGEYRLISDYVSSSGTFTTAECS